MKAQPRVCLIGDIVVDVTIQTQETKTKLRLGGITHAARALWALNVPFDVYYFAPSYLNDLIKAYLSHLGCVDLFQLGEVSGAPYVFLIQEAKEIGDQGYEFLLREEVKVKYYEETFKLLNERHYAEHLVISGNFDLAFLVNYLNGSIHVDVANNVVNFNVFLSLIRRLNTVFVSTSSDIFKTHFKQDFLEFAHKFQDYTDELILKENRGGSRGYRFSDKKIFKAHAQPRKIAHSVGVGDVFDACYVSTLNSSEEKLVLSSWIAAEYAVTSFPDDFKKGCDRVLKSEIKDLMNIPGIFLPWEIRKDINIYIAAPDFSFVDVRPINILEKALLYHNFVPRRPVQENGQMEEEASKARKQELVAKDFLLLELCSMMIVVLLYNDPGTLIELGYACSKGIPTIVYDPYKIASNCMLTELPDFVSDDLDEIITEVFIKSASLRNYEK